MKYFGSCIVLGCVLILFCVNSFILAQEEGGVKEYEAPIIVAILQDNSKRVEELIRTSNEITEIAPGGWTPLHAAASKGRTDWVQMLLEKKVNVNAKNDQLRTALQEAVHEGHYDVIKLLLDSGASINAQDDKGDTALHSACGLGKKDVTELLLNYKANPNLKNENEATPLYFASAFSHEDIVELLLERGADATVGTNTNITPLHEAGISGNVNIIKMLLDSGISATTESVDGWTPLHNTAQFGRAEATQLLIDYGANVNAKHIHSARTPIYVSCLNGTVETTAILLESGANPNVKDDAGTYPVHIAAFLNDNNKLGLLLANGADPNVRDEEGATALHKSVYARGYETTKALLTNGADPNLATFNKSWTPLLVSSAIGEGEIVGLLLSHKANPNHITFERTSPLLVACNGNHKYIVNKLIKAGANPSFHDALGWTGLHIAIQNNAVGVVEEFVSLSHPDYDINAAPNSVSPLMLASALGKSESVSLLLSHKNININQQDAQGYTALLHASLKSETEICIQLIKHNADITLKNDEGKDFLDFANESNNFDLIHFAIYHPDISLDLTDLDIESWLSYNDLSQYFEIFKEHEITGDVLPLLTNDLLRNQLGIKELGNLLRLSKAIKFITSPPPDSSSSKHIHDEL